MSGVSLVIAVLFNFRLVLRVLPPYLLLLAAFASFVMWNGGVVMGTSASSSSIDALSTLWLTVPIRRQREPRRLLAPCTDAVHLAVFHVLLLAHALSVAIEYKHSSEVPTQILSSAQRTVSTTQSNGFYTNHDGNAAGGALQHYRTPVHACR